MISKILNYLKTDIWRTHLRKHPPARSFVIKQLRIFLLALRGFDEDKCMLRASALTFYSLLAIVPMVAMAFGIAKGFGFEKILSQRLIESMPGQEDIAAQIIAFSQTLLENTRGGVIAGIGVAILFWTVIKVLGNIEKSFNDIWGIKKARSFGRKFSDYLSIMVICPILLIMSSSITVVITSQVKLITEKVALLGAVSQAIFFVLKLLPYSVIWLVFTFVYIFMPNTKVNLKAGVLAGIIAGTIYQVVQLVYIEFQIGVSKYNAIYGSFAALPLFLVWLQISWLIVLFGAEISFAHQNVETYEFEPDCLQVSYSFKRLLTLWMTHLLVKNFSKGEKPLTATEISHVLEIPIRLVRQILYELVEAGIISEIREEQDRGVYYQPARDVETFTLGYVIDTLEHHGSDKIPVAESKDLEKISEHLKTFKEAVKKSPANVLLKNI